MGVGTSDAKERTAQELFEQGLDAGKHHETDKAIKLIERVLEVRPRALNAYIALSILYARDKHDVMRAQTIMKRALAISPTDFPCQYEYAQLLIKQEKFSEAKEVLLDSNPETKADRLKRDKQVKEIAHYLTESKKH